jgi:hypothetical protein
MAQKYQVSMRHRPTPIDELNTVSVELNLKSFLWTSYLDWKELSKELYQAFFKSINQTIQKYLRINYQLSNGILGHTLVIPF